jgi:tetratricopeptide (TPR) repeat protein
MIYQALTKKSLNNKRNLLILATAGLMFAAQCLAGSSLAEKSINLLILRAQAALANGQSQQAAEWYEKAAAMGESAEAEIGLVRAYLQSGEFRKAIAFGYLVAAEHPDVSETAALLAYLEDREGHTTPALAKLSEELKKRPDDVALFGAQAEILIDRMAISQAIQQLDDWIGRNPPQGDIYRLRARAALVAGNREEMLNWRRKAALAYESKGELEAAKPLRNWLSKVDGNEQTTSTAGITLAPAGESKSAVDNTVTPIVTRWHAHYLEPFPFSSGNAMKSGNGFVVDQGRRVVTYASLVSGTSGDVWVRNGLGKIRKSRVEKILPDQGLALLRLEMPYAKEWSLPKQAFVVPEDMHFCFVLGFPVTDALENSYPILAPGVVVRRDAGFGGLMQVTSSLGPENSGSPVFDASGKFIGLTLGKQEPLKGIVDREALLGKGTFAVRADGLQKLLTNSARPGKKPAKTLASKGTQSVEELYEKLLPVVVTIVAPN